MTERERADEVKRLRWVASLVPLRMWRSVHHAQAAWGVACIATLMLVDFTECAAQADAFGCLGYGVVCGALVTTCAIDIRKWRRCLDAEERAARDA